MGAPNIAPTQLETEFNVLHTVDAQLRMADTLARNPALMPLMLTISDATSIADPTADRNVRVWAEFDRQMRPYEGTPFYSTMRTRFAEVTMAPFHKGIKYSTTEWRRLLTQQLLPGILQEFGNAAGENERIQLLTAMEESDVLPCYDGQNLTDSAHPGAVVDLATQQLVPNTQINLSTTFPLSTTNLEIVKARMTAYRDSQGTHLGNRWAPTQRRLPPTGNRDTIAITEPQFHLYVARDLEATAETIQTQLGNDGNNRFAERFTYTVHDEFPAGHWFVYWLNNDEPSAEKGAPFLHKRAGVDIMTSLGFDHLHNQQHRSHEINAHAEVGFAAFHWHRFYKAETA